MVTQKRRILMFGRHGWFHQFGREKGLAIFLFSQFGKWASTIAEGCNLLRRTAYWNHYNIFVSIYHPKGLIVNLIILLFNWYYQITSLGHILFHLICCTCSDTKIEILQKKILVEWNSIASNFLIFDPVSSVPPVTCMKKLICTYHTFTDFLLCDFIYCYSSYKYNASIPYILVV